MKNFLHHLEYEESGLNIEDVAKIVKEGKFFMIIALIKRIKKWKVIQQNLLKKIINYFQIILKNKSKFIGLVRLT